MLFILRVPFVCFLGKSKNTTVQKKSYIQRKHLEIHSDIKTIIILSDVIPSGELVLLGGGDSWCCTWKHWWWHGHGSGEASRLNTWRLSRAGIRAPLTAANHCDGSVWLSPSLPGVCSEASCQSHARPYA